MWTADEIKQISKLWESHTITEMAEKLGVNEQQVIYMGTQIRKVYPKLVPKKHRKGYISNLIKQTLG